MAAASADRLRAWHDRLASEPHMSGSEGDFRVIESIGAAFREMGLEVETQWIWPWLSVPVEAYVGIDAPEKRELSVVEPALAGDPFSQSARLLHMGWNAYSGSGDVIAPVVYANFGTREDFETLRSLGIDCSDRIVLARYGGNYRGFKAKFAEEAGAAGLIIFTDPADSGYMKGLMYPDGGWATPQQIQRGSLLTLDGKRTGDPLTPGWPSSEDAKRLDPESLALPKIPVQPVGWAAAQEIMQRMTGPAVPEGWQGGLPFTYRLTGGPLGQMDELRVRLRVVQKREITKTANVVGSLKGAAFPDELVVIGCHHDAWGFGAADPTCGTILVMEAARCFSEMAKQGMRPDRTILFGAWGAEEHGIIGSTEWVEAHRDALERGAVAYINLDMAAMGPQFVASAAPMLRRLIIDAARIVPQARDPARTVYDDWLSRAGKGASEPRIGELGGGSDHVPFYSWLGIPSMSLGSGGSRGTSYHSIYDNLHWYRLVVGDDYEPALMLTRIIGIVTSRLANADVPPLYGSDVAHAIAMQIRDMPAEVSSIGVAAPNALDELGRQRARLEQAEQRLRERIASGAAGREACAAMTAAARAALRLIDSSEPGAWHRNWWATPDPDSGYSVVTLPRVREAVARGGREQAAAAIAAVVARLAEMADRVEDAERRTP